MATPHRLVFGDGAATCQLDGRSVRDGDQLDLEMEAMVNGRIERVWRPGRFEASRDGATPPRLYLYGSDDIFVRLTPHSVVRWSTLPLPLPRGTQSRTITN